jgi:hypothetical protein
MTIQYLGTATGNTGIPSLLISSLNKVSDPNVYQALYQIQNWANSFKSLGSTIGQGGATAIFGGPVPDTAQIVYQSGLIGLTATAGNFSFGFGTGFSTGLLSLVMTAADAGNSNVIVLDSAATTNAIGAGQYFRNGSPLTGAGSVTYFASGW